MIFKATPIKMPEQMLKDEVMPSPSALISQIHVQLSLGLSDGELRNTSSRACSIQYLQDLDSDEKVATDESGYVFKLQTPFIPRAKCGQAPNDTDGEMKAANLTELCCLAAAGFTAGGADVFILQISFLSR